MVDGGGAEVGVRRPQGGVLDPRQEVDAVQQEGGRPRLRRGRCEGSEREGGGEEGGGRRAAAVPDYPSPLSWAGLASEEVDG